MKWLIKILSIGILFSSLCTPVVAQVGQGNPVVRRTPDPPIDEYIFSGGETLTLNRDEKYIFLLVNGTIIPDAKVKVIDGYSLVPLNIISEELGIKVTWQKGDSYVIIEKEKTSIKAIIGEKVAEVDGEEFNCGGTVTIIDDTLYVPVRFLARVFSFSLNYIPYSEEGREPISNILKNSVLTIDENITQKTLAEEEAKAIAKKYLMEKYNQFTLAGYYADILTYEETLSSIQKTINQMSVQGKTSRYWVFSGPKTVLVDEYNGNVFFLGEGYSSYIYNINDDESVFQIFGSGYFAG